MSFVVPLVARVASSAAVRTTRWLGAALIAAPFLQTLEWDFDRAAPLALLPLPLWSGRESLARAIDRLCRASLASRALAAAIATLAALATIFSPQPAAATVMLASWTLLALAALLTGQIVAEAPENARTLLAAVAWSAAIGAGCHLTRWKLGLPPEAAFYPHHRLMGLHLMSGAIAATALLASAGARSRVLWLALGAIAWGGLLWTGGRAPVIGAGAGLIAAGLAMRGGKPGGGVPSPRGGEATHASSRGVRAPRLHFASLAAALAIHLALGIAVAAALEPHVPHLGWTRLWRETVAAETTQEFTSNRTEFWRAAALRAVERPWLGRGPDTYRFLEPKLEGAQPHNVFLQWSLDLGFAGAILLALLLAWVLARGARRVRHENEIAGWVAIGVATTLAGQLDGFFYHHVALFPAALALGIAALRPTETETSVAPPRGFARTWVAPAVAAWCVLLLHTWIFYRVAIAPPPKPDDRIVRVWHAFPSATLNLERWIDAWRATSPTAALELSRHAQQHSAQGDFFHVQTAGLLLQLGDRAGALRELDDAVAIAPWQMRPVIVQLRARVSGEPATARH